MVKPMQNLHGLSVECKISDLRRGESGCHALNNDAGSSCWSKTAHSYCSIIASSYRSASVLRWLMDTRRGRTR